MLRVADAVLEGGYVNVYQARDRVSGGTKSPKGRRARRVPIEPSLRPLLELLVGERDGSDLLVTLPEGEQTSTRAGKMREHLKLAGVLRDELHADDAQRRPLAFHDLRHTFATWLALAGNLELTIQSRLGHATTDMTQHYLVEAEAIGRGDVGTPFPPLPASLLDGCRLVSVQTDRKISESRAGHGIRSLRITKCARGFAGGATARDLGERRACARRRFPDRSACG